MNPTSPSAESIHQGIETIAHNTVREHMRFVKASGLSMSQFGILMQLQHQHGCGVLDISNRMRISGPAASQLIDKLVQGGLLERAEDPHDRRAKRLQLSSAGLALLQASQAARHATIEAFIQQLDPAELQQVSQAMQIITRTYERLQSEDQPRIE